MLRESGAADAAPSLGVSGSWTLDDGDLRVDLGVHRVTPRGRFGGTAPASIRAPAGGDAANATLTTSLLGYDVAIPFPLRRAEPLAAAPPGEIDRPEGAVRELAAEEAPVLAASR